MKKIITLILTVALIVSCTQTEKEVAKVEVTKEVSKPKQTLDKRISLGLNLRQKNHQLSNMRSHLEAIQNIANDEFDKASVLAYEELGSTTEMKLMCASFGNKQFEDLGVSFHKSADEMSNIFKLKNKDESLKALSNTMNYCVQCHATFKQ